MAYPWVIKWWNIKKIEESLSDAIDKISVVPWVRFQKLVILANHVKASLRGSFTEEVCRYGPAYGSPWAAVFDQLPGLGGCGQHIAYAIKVKKYVFLFK